MIKIVEKKKHNCIKFKQKKCIHHLKFRRETKEK